MKRCTTRGRSTDVEPASRIDGTIRCAIYKRKSTEEGLEQEFNSLDAYQELRGELIEVYATGGGNVASEDTIDIGTDVYRVFNLYSGGWCAVKE